MLTQARLKERLSYDPSTGEFRTLVKVKQVPAGAVAGSIGSKGYRRIKVDNREYAAHRLAWLYVHGEFPPGDLDHKNRIRSDNRLDNLRPASRTQNGQNRSVAKNNSSGYTGVTFNKACRKWQASICTGGRARHLGLHSTPEAAAAAYRAAKAELHTFNPGRI